MLSIHHAHLLFIPQLFQLASSCLSQENCPCESCQRLFFCSILWTMLLLSFHDFSDDWVPLTASLLKTAFSMALCPSVVLILPLQAHTLLGLQFPSLHRSPGQIHSSDHSAEFWFYEFKCLLEPSLRRSPWHLGLIMPKILNPSQPHPNATPSLGFLGLGSSTPSHPLA